MKHSIKSLLLTVLVAFVSISASAYDFEVDGLYYNIVSADVNNLTCEVTHGSSAKYIEDIKIPSHVTYSGKSFTVVGIGDYAFKNCSGLTSVEIPNSVTSIGFWAFYGCESLTSVVIPNSVTSIGSMAFYFCTSLASIAIGNGVTEIKDGVNSTFDQCPITEITVGNAYVLKELHYKLYETNILTIAEDYSDTSFPDLRFSEYTHLYKLICKTATPPKLPNTFSSKQHLLMYVIVPTESLSDYESVYEWREFDNLYGGAESYTISGISNITIDYSDKAPTIYDLKGRKLSTPQRGLNIINGKKVVVK